MSREIEPRILHSLKMFLIDALRSALRANEFEEALDLLNMESRAEGPDEYKSEVQNLIRAAKSKDELSKAVEDLARRIY